jgi:hypothetical protein
MSTKNKGLKLRPEVKHFAELMEKKLRENDHKGERGWLNDTVQTLLYRTCEELGELVESFSGGSDKTIIAILLGAHHLDAAARALKQYEPTWPQLGRITSSERTIDEAVDVANFCMMVVDKLEGTHAEASK